MKVIRYDDKYKDDILEMFDDFYKNNSIDDGNLGLQKDAILKSIDKCREYSYLLIKDGKCVAVFFGYAVNYPYNDAKIFQEIFWHTNPRYAGQGVKLLKHVEKQLRKEGYRSIVMAVFHSYMHEKMHHLYTRLQYRPFETHYVKEIA